MSRTSPAMGGKRRCRFLCYKHMKRHFLNCENSVSFCQLLQNHNTVIKLQYVYLICPKFSWPSLLHECVHCGCTSHQTHCVSSAMKDFSLVAFSRSVSVCGLIDSPLLSLWLNCQLACYKYKALLEYTKLNISLWMHYDFQGMFAIPLRPQ